tara:strand:+ start:768 stop:989 length:222 start_codon:yes stop_codon:yes gene_type:complete
MARYKVTYSTDSLDTNPTVKEFDEHDEMEDWIHEEMSERISWVVQHSSYPITEEDLEALRETESTLLHIQVLN